MGFWETTFDLPSHWVIESLELHFSSQRGEERTHLHQGGRKCSSESGLLKVVLWKRSSESGPLKVVFWWPRWEWKVSSGNLTLSWKPILFVFIYFSFDGHHGNCLYTWCYEILEWQYILKKFGTCKHIMADGIRIFAHFAYCFCVERMKLVFRPINMNVYHVLIWEKKIHFLS